MGDATGISWCHHTHPHTESGKDSWALSLRDQCASAGVPFHFKQAGNVLAREWGCESRTGHVASEWPEPFPQEFPAEPSEVSA